MKVLILACLVALALAREKEELSITTETVESLSSSEELIAHLNKQKPKKFEHEKHQGKEDEHQDKIQSLVQPQPLLYPFAEPFPYNVLPQNGLPLAQPAVVLPILQPEVMQVPITKETIFPKRQVMPFIQSPIVPIFQRQIPNVPQLPLPLLQPLMHQVPQPLLQAPMLPPQPLLSLPQPKALPLSQQVITYPQRDLPNQEPLLDSAQVFYPVTEPIATIYNLQQGLQDSELPVPSQLPLVSNPRILERRTPCDALHPSAAVVSQTQEEQRPAGALPQLVASLYSLLHTF
ncbi:beta-casein [Pteronotus mesoamericanus]|uniref:beta-casein n=1 Tax=Pteronotus mesoamericanus TaxID=1884717 RepID=UPI0023EBDD5F|nr:beta-casein [Pteronotus parnellii mesoamericanus]